MAYAVPCMTRSYQSVIEADVLQADKPNLQPLASRSPKRRNKVSGGDPTQAAKLEWDPYFMFNLTAIGNTRSLDTLLIPYNGERTVYVRRAGG